MQIYVLSSYTPGNQPSLNVEPDYGEDKVLGVFSNQEEMEQYIDYLCSLPENSDTAFFGGPHELDALKVPFPYDDNSRGH